MSNLLEPRFQFKPFEYPEAFEYYRTLSQMHWLGIEVPMSGDTIDWEQNLSETDKLVIGQILKGFTQTEVIIADYWSTKVCKWFQKPEVQMAGRLIAAQEIEHQFSYDYLNTILGVEDYRAFLEDPTVKARLDRLLEVEDSSDRRQIARSLAIFSAFSEGVSLFSQFIILMSYSRRNMLKGVGQITAYSSLDESVHSKYGCWLFREFIKENLDIWDDNLKKDIYEAARLTVRLEDDFIDKVYSFGDVIGVDKDCLKQYIRFKTNSKLGELGLKSNWKNLDMSRVEDVSIPFDLMLSDLSSQDFFAQREVQYSKGVNFDKMWEGIDVTGNER